MKNIKFENGWTKSFLNWDKLMEQQKEPRKLYITEEMEQATHWRALDDENHNDDSITSGRLYRLYYDKYDDETVLFDDSNRNSTAYMWHNGEWVIMEGSSQWHEFVEGR